MAHPDQKSLFVEISRKDFIQRIWSIILLPYVLLLILMEQKHKQVSTQKIIKIPDELSNPITFFDEFICIRSNQELKIYSSTCTHLGCRINKTHQGVLVCPCHGSSFNFEGKVLTGPATKNLTALHFVHHKETNEIVISLNNS